MNDAQAITATRCMIIEKKGDLNLLNSRLAEDIKRVAETRKRIRSVKRDVERLAKILDNQCKREEKIKGYTDPTTKKFLKSINDSLFKEG